VTVASQRPPTEAAGSGAAANRALNTIIAPVIYTPKKRARKAVSLPGPGLRKLVSVPTV
jgi:hypothetical protein